MEKKTRQLKVDESTHATIKIISEVTGKQMNDVVMESVAVYPNTLDKPLRDKIVLMVKHANGHIEVNPLIENGVITDWPAEVDRE